MIDKALAIPQILAAKNVLCVQPHYDDNDIGAGGTIAALKARGARITYVTVTDDLVGVVDDSLSDAEASKSLRRDQLAAGAILGIDGQYFLGYPDAGKYDYFELRSLLIAVMRRVRPDFVMTCDPWLPYEYHNDHVLAGRAAVEAACLQAGVRRLKTDPAIDTAYVPYEVTGITFYWTTAPNTVVDIGAFREAKHRAIDCYRTQFTDDGMRMLHALIDHKERDFAAGTAYEHAERLKTLTPLQLHCNVDAVRM